MQSIIKKSPKTHKHPCAASATDPLALAAAPPSSLPLAHYLSGVCLSPGGPLAPSASSQSAEPQICCPSPLSPQAPTLDNIGVTLAQQHHEHIDLEVHAVQVNATHSICCLD